ncbi:MAG: hypothetical protein ACI8QC_001898 [Planctomycetota bacterium]|jgi:hypothetical protein
MPSLPRTLWTCLFLIPWFCAGCGSDEPASEPDFEASASVTQAPAAPKPSFDLRDPSRDGWTSEVWNERAGEALKKLTPLLQVQAGEESLPVKWLDAGLLVSVPDLDALDSVRDTAPVLVERQGEQVLEGDLALFYRHLSGLSQEGAQVKFKVVAVEVEGEELRTEQKLELGAVHAGNSVEVNALWLARWAIQGESLRLIELEVQDLERVTVSSGAGGTLFEDHTGSLMAGQPFYEEHISQGLDHWARHVEALHGISLYRHCGAAVGDVNGDGREDLYLCQTSGLPNRLLLQQADGSVRDYAAAAGVDWLEHSASALLVDLDGDGNLDLAVATRAGLLLQPGHGDGTFGKTVPLALVDSDVYALSAADFDLDGDLDLYLTSDFQDRAARLDRPRVGFNYTDANDGGANVLFRNQGAFAFANVTEEVGLDVNNRRHSLAAAWADYDGDGDPDLYVANDYGHNCLYRNDGGHFTEVAVELGVVDVGSGMSASWGDYNQDGLLDVHVSNMFSSAGNRITSQPEFMPDVDEDTRALYRRFAKGNTLFRQTANGRFVEAEEAHVEMARWAWGSVFLDVDGDGVLDLVTGNGYISTEDSGDL